MESKAVYIYGLFDPRTLELRYIGKANNPESRLYNHIWEAKREKGKNTHKDYWIRQLLNEGLQPAIEVLEECTTDTWQEAECSWIDSCQRFGVRLVNLAKGGQAPIPFNELPEAQREAIRKKWSETRTGRPSANRGRKWSQEYKDKMSASLSGENNPMYGKFGKDHPATGRTVADITKQRLSEALRGEGNPFYGKTHTAEARKKLSEAGKGRRQTEEDRKKKSLSNKMNRAKKKGLLDSVLSLQVEYFNLFGCYHPKYPHQ